MEESLNNYEICPWQLKEMQRLIANLRYFQEAENDQFVSVLSFLIGKSLIRNGSDEDVARGQEYIKYSIDIMLKHNPFPNDIVGYLGSLDK
ncbi:hypothetical protein H6784_05715 [Candidatus Nomurabacteria bacterium]|nr:hypothetical protein [Candidatus Kaiserbacteria bacterium]MCB9814874.1 hypothetical protein [Candidatus Nomurabacteria bacterium]